MANIVAGQYTGMGLDTPVTGSAGRRYRVTLKPEYTGSGRLTVGCSNGAVLWNDTFTVNGKAVDGTLALLVTYKQIGGFLTRFFLLVGLLASVVVFLGIYFAMRGRMPLHRLCLCWCSALACCTALCCRPMPHRTKNTTSTSPLL